MSAKTYSKKPVEIQAMQVVIGSTTKDEILAFCPTANVGAPGNDARDIRWIVIPTLEGGMHASDGDFIICGVQGEFYPCKPDIFAKTYEEVTRA